MAVTRPRTRARALRRAPRSPLLVALFSLAAARAVADETAAVSEGTPPTEAVSEGTPSKVTGALHAGVYGDSDRTYVFRSIASVGGTVGNWTVTGTGAVDVVSSASVDVRSSPGLSKVDVVTTASGTSTSGGKMFDRRLQATLGAGYSNQNGRAIGFSASYANENDYNSISGNLNGSVDLYHRMTTLLGGVSFTQNWIASVLDRKFAEKMHELSWSGGLAQVLSRRSALRLRYDGSYASGYQASPYRYVRFGDWTTSRGANEQIVFANTLGSSNGLAEKEPDQRIRHAVTLEWLHSLTQHLALYTQVRLGLDTWGVMNVSPTLELRGAWDRWRLQLGYRFYAQTAADFYQAKYTSASSTYAFYTSDKELGRERGHMPYVDLARIIKQPRNAYDSRVLFDTRVSAMFYSYPDFVLLASRVGVFVDLGFTWE